MVKAVTEPEVDQLVVGKQVFYPAGAHVDLATGQSNEKNKDVGRRLAPLKQQSAPLRNKIIMALRSAIEMGFLKPGQRLVEMDLCEQLSVSRTSLREALRELQAEGILEHASNRGLSVSAVSVEDAKNIYRLRSVLEALIVEQFIERATDEQIKDLVQESENLKNAYRSGILEDMLSAKRTFTDRICSGAQNPIAFEMISRLALRTSSLRARSLVRKERQLQSIEEVNTLMATIQRRDIEAARDAAIRYVNNASHSALGTE
jgi:DNA-binding GntR family transcriptional regulator